MNKILLVVLISLSLSSCSLFTPVTPPDESAYVIKTVPNDVPVRKKHSTTMLVLFPDTAAMFNTRSMAYTNKPFQISYYGQNRWAETPAQMLMPIMIKTLQKTNYYRAVISPPYGGKYDYMLTTEITEVLQDYNGCVPMFRFTLHAQLSRALTGQIVAVKDFSVSIPIKKESVYSGVLAANHAVADVLGELADFCVRNSNA